MGNKKNFAYAVSANLLSTLVSAVITLLLPKVISVESYGYFQYYLFWAGYLGLLHLGWIDGLYLVHCGEYYEDIHKGSISRQIRSFALFQAILSCVIICATLVLSRNEDYRFIFICIGVLLVITNLRLFVLYLLQATARIKEYSIATICGLIVYMAVVIILLVLRVKEYSYYIFANILSMMVPLIVGLFYCKDVVLTKPVPFQSSIKQSLNYVNIGSKLLIANFASSWIIGVARLMIERQWDIATFGKISLTITISNMFMTFINAIALVLLPMLRRMDEERLVPLYGHLNTLLLTALFGGMIFYYPVQRILSIWLPEYADSLAYMALLFPICVFESKNAMVLNTYLKALRKEKAIMIINVATVGISALLSAVAIFLFKDLTLSMLFIVVALGIRCIVFEVYLKKQIGLNVERHILEEVLMSFLFMLCNWKMGGMVGLCAYTGIYIAFILINWKQIKESYNALISK